MEIETTKLQAEMTRIQNDAQKLASKYSEEKEGLEKRMQELSQSAREEVERASAEYRRQMSALQTQLDTTSSTSAAERAELIRRIDELQNRRSHGGGGFFGMLGRALDGLFGMH